MDITVYQKLIQNFLDGSLSPQEFETEYLKHHKQDTVLHQDTIGYALDNLFTAVDCYWRETTPETETSFEISEQSLRRIAEQALTILKTNI